MDREGASGERFWRRRLGAVAALALLSAGPLVVFEQTARDAVTSEFRLELNYLVTGWAPWAMIALGLLCFVPVVVSIGRSAFSRWSLSPAVRRAWEIWGVTLYLLGLLLLVQTAQIAAAH